jgi:hypothetical protein
MSSGNSGVWLSSLLELDYYPVANEEMWKKWRHKNRLTPTSSLLSGYFGHGYESYHKTLSDKIQGPPPPVVGTKPSQYNFKNAALFHGLTNESKAKDAYWLYLQNFCSGIKTLKMLNNGEVSTKYQLMLEEGETHLIATPDLVVEINDSPVVVEFKCPFYVLVKRKDKTISQVALEFSIAHPYGKENSFIQAATYSMVHGATEFHTVYYFGNNADEEIIIVYKYMMTDDLVEDIYEGICQTERDLIKLFEDKRLKFRSKGERTKKMTSYLSQNMLSRTVYFPISNNTCKAESTGSPNNSQSSDEEASE